MQRALIGLGLLLVALGVLWPWLSRLGLGRLPGDFLYRKDGFTFYFPLTTGILVSLIVSLLFWIFRR